MSVNHNRNEKFKHKIFRQSYQNSKKSVIARSHKQSEYNKALRENDIVMALDLQVQEIVGSFSSNNYVV